jgi:membrane fusion protein (multidrug efflux system)
VAKLLVSDNQLVRQGDLLLQIDSRDYELALQQAKAALATSVSRREQAEAQVTTAAAQSVAATADVAAARATAENARVDLERNRKLAPQGAVSQQALDSAIERARSSAAQESAAIGRAAAAEAQTKLANTQLDTARAEVNEAQVRVATAELNLSYTRVVAPITGRVTHRTVNLGDYLSAGQALFALVDPNVWVTANFKEGQLTHMETGQPVEINIDAYSGRKLRAHVDSFQRGTGARFSLLPAENATGNYVKVVQRVPVKILFDNPPPDDMILGPGMSVEPTVTVRP